MSGQLVGRLAPSPTGAQHLGNARTFLAAFWSARSNDARLILRIEDIDSPRVKTWATAQAIEDLAWLGIEHDGEPIIQTDRADAYQIVLEKMIEDDRVYPCTCTRKDIEQAASAPHETSRSNANLLSPVDAISPVNSIEPETTVYTGTCSDWRNTDPVPPTGTYCWRFRMDPEPMSTDDRVAGRLVCEPATALGDFPVTRKDDPSATQPQVANQSVAAYQLAVVVDDLDSGVTEVVRGDDLIASVFRQNQIYAYLGHTPPSYAHLPLVVGVDGRRLAKRHGDTRLSWYREQGVAPEQIVGWAARTLFGNSDWFPNPPLTTKWTVDQWHRYMIERFDWAAVNQRRVVVDSRTWPDGSNVVAD